jgi:glycerophosphoryl diester phosphodiesterase
MNYLNQIVNYHKPKRSTFTFNNNSNTNTNDTNTNTTQTLTREQLRELRLRHFNKSSFGKRIVNYYTKYKHKTRREALIKLRKFFTKTIKTHEF